MLMYLSYWNSLASTVTPEVLCTGDNDANTNDDNVLMSTTMMTMQPNYIYCTELVIGQSAKHTLG